VKRDSGQDIPIKRAGFSIRSPWAVMILMPFQLPIALSIFAVSIVFTVWPDALQHSPISFETQGFVHHAWHYSLALGSMLLLAGMFLVSTRRLAIELSGIAVLIGALTMNLIALVAIVVSPGGDEEPSGLGLAIRVGIITGLAIRAHIIVTEPVVTVGQRPLSGD